MAEKGKYLPQQIAQECNTARLRPARFPTATPDRLYQPIPEAIAALWFSGIPTSSPLTIPPASDPAMIPMESQIS